MTSLNVYTCTQAELETFHQIGATSSAKIVALRDAVIAGQRPEITVADLAEIRLTADQWQSSIDQGDLSLDFHATGHFTDISPNAKTNAEKFTFTSQSPLGKDTTQTIEDSLNVLTANMESLSAQMMYLGQTLSDRMGQLHNTVTGMQQDTDTLANSMHKIETQNKDMQKHLFDHDKFVEDMSKILKPVSIPPITTPLPISHKKNITSESLTHTSPHMITTPSISQPLHTAQPLSAEVMLPSVQQHQAVWQTSVAQQLPTILQTPSVLDVKPKTLTWHEPPSPIEVKPKTSQETQIEAISAVIPDSGIYPPKQQTQQPYQQYGQKQMQHIYQPPALQQQTPQQQQQQTYQQTQQQQQTSPHQQMPQQQTYLQAQQQQISQQQPYPQKPQQQQTQQQQTQQQTSQQQTHQQTYQQTPQQQLQQQQTQQQQNQQTQQQQDNSYTFSTDQRGRSRSRQSDRQSSYGSRSRSRSPAPQKLQFFSGDPTKLSWRGFITKFDRVALRRGWSDNKKLDRLFDCLTDKALEYANRAEGRDYSSLKNELALRFDLRDEPVAARQRLHVIKQSEEESLEDFLQRVLTVTIDGYGDAQFATLQQLATEAFLRGCKFKDAATLVMNEAPKSIQEACRRVKTVIANKKAVGATKVSFQERAFTFQEETRVASIEKKVDDLVETFHRAIPSYRSPSRSPSRYPAGPQGYNNWPRQRSPAGY